MSAHDASVTQVSHRSRASVIILWFALLAAPVAWSLQLLISAGLAGFGCRALAAPLSAAGSGGVWAALFVITLAAIGITLLAIVLAVRNWRKSGANSLAVMRQEPSPEAGRGSYAYLAMWAILTSGYMLIPLIFSLIGVIIVLVCA